LFHRAPSFFFPRLTLTLGFSVALSPPFETQVFFYLVTSLRILFSAFKSPPTRSCIFSILLSRWPAKFFPLFRYRATEKSFTPHSGLTGWGAGPQDCEACLGVSSSKKLLSLRFATPKLSPDRVSSITGHAVGVECPPSFDSGFPLVSMSNYVWVFFTDLVLQLCRTPSMHIVYLPPSGRQILSFLGNSVVLFLLRIPPLPPPKHLTRSGSRAPCFSSTNLIRSISPIHHKFAARYSRRAVSGLRVNFWSPHGPLPHQTVPFSFPIIPFLFPGDCESNAT